MTCRKCGAVIADKALICYKCGAATTDPVVQPPAMSRSRLSANTIVSAIALVLLVLVALYLGRVPSGQSPRYLNVIVVGIAIALVAIRAILRRRR